MTQQPHTHNLDKDTDEMSLKEFILKIISWYKYLLRNKALIIVAWVVGVALGLTYAFIKKTVYKGELTFALQGEKSGGLSGAMGLASQFGLDVGGSNSGGEFSGDNLLELIKSRTIIEKALLTPVVINGKNQTLADYYINFNNIRDDWEGKPSLANMHFMPNADRSKFTLKQDSILGLFYKGLIKNNVSVEKIDKKLSIILLRVSSTDEMFSKYFTEVLTKVVSDFYIQSKTAKSSKNVAILQRQADSVRRVLYSGISGVASSLDANPNPNPLLQSLRVPSQSKSVSVQTNTAILTELVKNLEVSRMSLLQETPLIQVIDAPILPLEKEKPSKIKSLIFGGFLGVFIAVIFLTVDKILKGLIS